MELDFNNVETLNGLEAWRRLVAKPRCESRSLARRFALRDKVKRRGLRYGFYAEWYIRILFSSLSIHNQ